MPVVERGFGGMGTHMRRASPTMIAASSMWAGWEPSWAPLLRVMTIVFCCFQSVPVGTIGGVSMFLECAVEVRVSGVPSTIYVDGVAGGEKASKLERALIGG